MDFLGGSATGFRHERRAESAKDLRTGAYGDWQFDLPAESHRGSKAELRRDLQGGLQEDCRSDFDGALRAEPDGTTDEHGWTQITNKRPKAEVRRQTAEVRMSGATEPRK